MKPQKCNNDKTTVNNKFKFPIYPSKQVNRNKFKIYFLILTEIKVVPLRAFKNMLRC